MHIGKIAKITLLAVMVAAVALSCSLLDYELEFEIIDVSDGFGLNEVDVEYTLYNAGSRTLYDATISILVYSDGVPQFELPTPGVDLYVGETATGTLTFTLTSAPVSPTAIVVSAGWNDADDF